MRLQGHYFALATLAFGEVMRVVANTWASLTGGPVGISVPFLPENAWMYSFKTGLPHAYIALAALVLDDSTCSRRSAAARWGTAFVRSASMSLQPRSSESILPA